MSIIDVLHEKGMDLVEAEKRLTEVKSEIFYEMSKDIESLEWAMRNGMIKVDWQAIKRGSIRNR